MNLTGFLLTSKYVDAVGSIYYVDDPIGNFGVIFF